MKSWKRAKFRARFRSGQIPRPGCIFSSQFPVLGSQLFLVEKLDGLQDYLAYDLDAFGAEFVEGVLRGVVEDVAVAVVEIDEVGTRHAEMNERQVIVFDGDGASEEV